MEQQQVINVEEIIAVLRQESKSNNMEDIEPFDDVCCFGFRENMNVEEFDQNELFLEMEAANECFIISPEFAIEGRFKFFKKIIRKFTYFIACHFSERLTEYNMHIVRSMNQIRNYIFHKYDDDHAVKELKTIVAGEVTSKITAQSNRIRELSKENKELKRVVEHCEDLLKNYQKDLETASTRIELLNVKLEIVEQKCQLLHR